MLYSQSPPLADHETAEENSPQGFGRERETRSEPRFGRRPTSASIHSLHPPRRPSIGRRMFRAMTRFVIVVLIGVGGTLGSILTGFFADESVNSNLTTNLSGYVGKTLWVEQLKASALTLVIALAGTFVLASIVKLVIGLRPGVEDELTGLDYTDHGEAGYHDEESGGHVAGLGALSAEAEGAATHQVAT